MIKITGFTNRFRPSAIHLLTEAPGLINNSLIVYNIPLSKFRTPITSLAIYVRSIRRNSLALPKLTQ